MSFREIVAEIADGRSSIIEVKKEPARVNVLLFVLSMPSIETSYVSRRCKKSHRCGEQMMRVTARALAISLAKLTRSGFLGSRQAARNDFPSCYRTVDGRGLAVVSPEARTVSLQLEFLSPMYANSGNTGHHHSPQIVINWSYRARFKEWSSFSFSFLFSFL